MRGEHSITPELTAVPTPGHTPGHVSILVLPGRAGARPRRRRAHARAVPGARLGLARGHGPRADAPDAARARRAPRANRSSSRPAISRRPASAASSAWRASATGAGCRASRHPLGTPCGDGVRPAAPRLSPRRRARGRHRIRDGRIAELGDLAGRAAGRLVELGGRSSRRASWTPTSISTRRTSCRARRAARDAGGSDPRHRRGQARLHVEDIRARARRLLDRAVAMGTTAMRGHVEVDPIVELRGLEAVLPLEREYADRLDLQLCAFAQEGILQAPGTEALLARGAPGRRRPRRRLPLQRHRRRRARGPGVRPRARASAATPTFTPTSPTSRCTATWR